MIQKLKEARVEFNSGKIVFGKFGDSETLSNKLTSLISEGKKTATCCLRKSLEADGEKIPTVGDIEIVTDWNDSPLFAILYSQIEIKKFYEVTEDFAKDEGEGNLSLEYWKLAHTEFIKRECNVLGIEFSENLELVCSRFKVVCKF